MATYLSRGAYTKVFYCKRKNKVYYRTNDVIKLILALKPLYKFPKLSVSENKKYDLEGEFYPYVYSAPGENTDNRCLGPSDFKEKLKPADRIIFEDLLCFYKEYCRVYEDFVSACYKYIRDERTRKSIIQMHNNIRQFGLFPIFDWLGGNLACTESGSLILLDIFHVRLGRS